MSPRKHQCELRLGSDSMLPVAHTLSQKFWRNVRKLGQVSMHHPETPYFFQSNPAVVAERQRQLLEEDYRVIHPLSIFSIFWEAIMIMVNLCHICLSSFRLFYVLHPLDKQTLTCYDKVLLVFHLLCLSDVVMSFNIGRVNRKYRTIMVNRRSIAWLYLKSWFLVDFVSCLPIAFGILCFKNPKPRFLLIAHMLPMIRIARIGTIISNCGTIIQLFSSSYIVQGIVRLPAVMLLSAHLGACLMYLSPVITYYWTGVLPRDYNNYLRISGSSNLLNFSISQRYNKAFVIVISAFCGPGFSMFHSRQPDELFIHSCIIIYASVFMLFTLVFIIKTYMTLYESELRYNGLMNQVDEYMKYRQFPLTLRKRVMAYYDYKHQKHYFKESINLAYLSEALRDDVQLYTCRILIDKVKIFEKIPADTVGTILACLRAEVCLANDLVVASGEIGDCMYFIASGTVAVYSLKGVEMCHLGDGEHFGEVALLVKDSKRSVTVVAVETTLIYRLDGDDFRRYVATQPMLMERIEALASRRMHETVLVDEAYRQNKELHRESVADMHQEPNS